jgi:hypothetical protein
MSPTATPSPRGPHGATGFFYPSGAATPARPATRATYGHSRNNSSTAYDFTTTAARPSPRYTSDGYYATANVSGSSRKPSSYQQSSPSPCPPPRPQTQQPSASSSSRRRSSFVFVRSSTPQAAAATESDEDEIIEVNGRTYILPADSRRRSGAATTTGSRPQRPVVVHDNTPLSSSSSPSAQYYEVAGDRGADYYVYKQGGLAYVDPRDAPAYDSTSGAASPNASAGGASPSGAAAAAASSSSSRPRDSAATPRPQGTRRTSASIPARSQTARPASAHGKKPSSASASAAAAAAAAASSSSAGSASAKVAKASEADAKKHHIPAGYSLKNWDPTESPILLLGSVFDANSLGKWIYDWTVYAQGPTHPISEIAGDLWLLLIQLAGKIRRAEDVIAKVRTSENKETIVEFLESGERLMDKLRKLLKTCEEPMLKSAKKNAQLGKNAGIEFVETLFGRDRVLDRTEKFMQGVRTFNLRFDANCDDIIKNPTM